MSCLPNLEHGDHQARRSPRHHSPEQQQPLSNGIDPFKSSLTRNGSVLPRQQYRIRCPPTIGQHQGPSRTATCSLASAETDAWQVTC